MLFFQQFQKLCRTNLAKFVYHFKHLSLDISLEHLLKFSSRQFSSSMYQKNHTRLELTVKNDRIIKPVKPVWSSGKMGKCSKLYSTQYVFVASLQYFGGFCLNDMYLIGHGSIFKFSHEITKFWRIGAGPVVKGDRMQITFRFETT